MQRRSLFAGLAGMLAAPKVAAGVPAAVPADFVPTFSEWVVGEAAEFPTLIAGAQWHE